MATEGQHIADTIDRNLRQLVDELRGVPDEELNRPLDIQPSNTLYQLGFHVLGSARYWAITLAGGEDFHRDRPAEFVSSGSGGGLLADLEALVERVHAQLDPLDSGDMEARVADQAGFRPGSRGDRDMTLRGSLLHALEHTALHLGHAQISRQLLGYGPVQED